MTHEVNEPSAKYLARASHKRTAIGLIPHDWAVLALADIAAIERGKFSARPRNDPKYYGGEFPFIQTGDVTRSSGSITTFTQTLNREGLRVSRLFPEGTLFFTIAANIGDVGIAKFEAACPDSLVAIVPHAGIQKGWLLYELARRKSDFESLASPGAQLNINLEKLRPYLLPVPTEAEQRAIAAALSDADALIAGLEKLIAKKRDLKQAAMQQLLTGQTRLPGFSGEWEARPLIDVADIATGLNKSTDEMGFGSLYVTVQDLYSGTSIDVDRIGRINASPAEVAANRLEPGDIVFGKSSVKRDGIGYPSQFLGAAEPTLFSGFCYRARAKLDAANPIFLFYALRSSPTRRWLIDNSQASALTNINKLIADRIPLVLPPSVEEQTAIATVLSAMDAELSALEERREKTRELKQGMMQELLTGRTRLV